MLKKKKEEITVTGRVAHRSIRAGHPTKVTDKDIAISLIIRPVDKMISHALRKDVIHQKDHTHLLTELK
ncbi:hypothetical protein A2U01_0088921, partial [Trifolium medium]|nr:hypothetical protein [Trifolium medium]